MSSVASSPLTLLGSSAVAPLPRSPLAIESRAALGLPANRAIVLSGHQAELWHPGIVAKWFATQRIATRDDVHAAWIVVDHDTNDPGVLAFPGVDRVKGSSEASTGHDSRVPVRAHWRWHPDPARPRPDMLPTRVRAAGTPGPVPADASCWSSDVPGRLMLARNALAKHARESSLAQQVTHAGVDMLASIPASGTASVPVSGRAAGPTLLWAKNLASTPIARALRACMLASPRACSEAYNAAAKALPQAGIRSLTSDAHAGHAIEASLELPWWRITPAGRVGVRASGLETLPETDAAPKALLLTLALRLACCDLFIHGLGGGIYDQVTERWLSRWLGPDAPASTRQLVPAPLLALIDERDGRLTPAMVVSATLRLPFDGVSIPTPTQIDRDLWRAHQSRHRLLVDASPAGSMDDGPAHDADAKRAMVEVIARRKAAGDRAGAKASYLALHEQLAQSRTAHASQLRASEQSATAARQARAKSAIVHDRTWSFALHAPDAIADLRERLERAL